MIGEFTGSKKYQFPYNLSAEVGQQIITEDSIPNDFKLIDPDHLVKPKIMRLFNHWLDRQSQGLVPFEVINCNPQHEKAVTKSKKVKGKEKAKPQYMDVSADDEKKDENDDDDEKKIKYPATKTAGSSHLPPPKPPAADVEESDSDLPSISAAVKIGPPKRSSNRPTPVAGSSTLPPVENTKGAPKAKKGKRDDLGGQPEKPAKPKNGKASKRKRDEEPEEPEGSPKKKSKSR